MCTRKFIQFKVFSEKGHFILFLIVSKIKHLVKMTKNYYYKINTTNFFTAQINYVLIIFIGVKLIILFFI